MLAAVEEMHQNGLLHRDVKPANFGISPASYSMSSSDNFEGVYLILLLPCVPPCLASTLVPYAALLLFTAGTTSIVCSFLWS